MGVAEPGRADLLGAQGDHRVHALGRDVVDGLGVVAANVYALLGQHRHRFGAHL